MVSALPLSGPSFDFGTEPKADATGAEFDNGSWHLGVTAQIGRDAVAVREPEDVGDDLRVDEVVAVDPRRHGAESNYVDNVVSDNPSMPVRSRWLVLTLVLASAALAAGLFADRPFRPTGRGVIARRRSARS